LSLPPSNREGSLSAAECDAYLERIGYRGSREVSCTTLRDLHLAHPRSVPFENLDISAGREVRL
jgi:N-hydroxyarylamine O-acetyltransferase